MFEKGPDVLDGRKFWAHPLPELSLFFPTLEEAMDYLKRFKRALRVQGQHDQQSNP
jgi:hypothetical protein